VARNLSPGSATTKDGFTAKIMMKAETGRFRLKGTVKLNIGAPMTTASAASISLRRVSCSATLDRRGTRRR